MQISAAIAEVLQGKLKVDPSRVYLKVITDREHGGTRGGVSTAPVGEA